MRTLTEKGADLEFEFISEYRDKGCSCHIDPPCYTCTHPGNPNNLAEDDSLWEDQPDDE